MSPVSVDLWKGQSGSCSSPGGLVFRGLGWKRLRFPCSWALLRHSGLGWILFDTGYADHFFEATKPFPERLYRWATPVQLGANDSAAQQVHRWGIQPEDVAFVILSHLHGDHVAGLRDFPRARIVVHSDALTAYRGLGRWTRVRKAFLAALLPADFESRLEPVGFQGRFHDWSGDGSLTLVDLPGHAPGHLGLLCQSREGTTLFGADCAWSRAELEGTRMIHPVARKVLHDPAGYSATQGWLRGYLQAHPEVQLVLCHE